MNAADKVREEIARLEEEWDRNDDNGQYAAQRKIRKELDKKYKQLKELNEGTTNN